MPPMHCRGTGHLPRIENGHQPPPLVDGSPKNLVRQTPLHTRLVLDLILHTDGHRQQHPRRRCGVDGKLREIPQSLATEDAESEEQLGGVGVFGAGLGPTIDLARGATAQDLGQS